MSVYGVFSDNPQTEWLSGPGKNRDMILLRDFSYTDPEGKVWMAPAGSLINGASIPMPLWSTVGSPYTGDYRNASIVHDVACDQAQSAHERQSADRMFYYACLAGGCTQPHARLLYLGVRTGAWVTGKTGWLAKLQPQNLWYRLRSQPRFPEEIELSDTFEQIRLQLDKLTEADEFEELERLVDAELK